MKDKNKIVLLFLNICILSYVIFFKNNDDIPSKLILVVMVNSFQGLLYENKKLSRINSILSLVLFISILILEQYSNFFKY